MVASPARIFVIFNDAGSSFELLAEGVRTDPQCHREPYGAIDGLTSAMKSFDENMICVQYSKLT